MKLKKQTIPNKMGMEKGGGGGREVEDPLIKDIVTVRNTES